MTASKRRRRDGNWDLEVFPTPPDLVCELVPKIASLCKGCVFIDTSAGDGFVTSLLRKNHNMKTHAFDIAPPKKKLDKVTKKDWMDVTIQDVKSKGPFVVGFNTPFGFAGSKVTEMINHAISVFDPDFFALILPWARFRRGIPGYSRIYKKDVANRFINVNNHVHFGIYKKGVGKPRKKRLLTRPYWVKEIFYKPKIIPLMNKRSYVCVRIIGSGRGLRGFYTMNISKGWTTFDFMNPRKHFKKHKTAESALYGRPISSFIVLSVRRGTPKKVLLASIESVKNMALKLTPKRLSITTSALLHAMNS